MRAARFAMPLASFLFAAPAFAGAWPVSTVASFGPAPSLGIGAKGFDPGLSFALESSWHPEREETWTLRAGRTSLSRALDGASAFRFFAGDQLYLPESGAAPAAVDVDQLQLGLRRSFAVGRVRPFVEGGVGASLVRDVNSRVGSQAYNDRRPVDPATRPAAPALESDVAPHFSVGIGASTTLPGGIALLTSIGAEFAAIGGLVGAQMPVRFGAAWPAGSAGAIVPGSPRAPRLSAAAGWSALHAPQRIEGGLGRGHSFSAELEMPLSERLSVSLVGERETREARGPYYRQQISNFGTVEYVPAGSVEAAFAATTATLGFRVRQPAGRAAISLRSGVGFGRTSGFGMTVLSPSGAYLDPYGQWLPATELAAIGGGAAMTGWAFAVSAGSDVRVAGPAHLFAETGLTSIEFAGDHVRATPLRFGVALH